MILLTIKEFDTRGKTSQEGEFDRAWFRLSNEESNQTIDYSMVNKVKEKVEEYQPEIPQEDEDQPPIRNDLTYLHGVLYLETSGRWVFESFKDAFQAKDYASVQGGVAQKLGELYGRSISEYTDQQK